MVSILFTYLLISNSLHQEMTYNDKIAVNNYGRDSIVYYKEIHYKTKKISVSYATSGILVIRDLLAHSIIKRDTLGSVPPDAIKIEDYNHDGVKDIRYGYNSNYFYENILVFDFTSQTWMELKNIKKTEFAYSEQIPRSNVYYSFTPNGCGKNNWLSYLFVIDNLTVKPIGLLQYRQCQDDQKGIYIYKLAKTGQKLMQKLPLQPVGDEIDFYKQYWKKHFKEYLR
jgi:hypothetical protein